MSRDDFATLTVRRLRSRLASCACVGCAYIICASYSPGGNASSWLCFSISIGWSGPRTTNPVFTGTSFRCSDTNSWMFCTGPSRPASSEYALSTARFSLFLEVRLGGLGVLVLRGERDFLFALGFFFFRRRLERGKSSSIYTKQHSSHSMSPQPEQIYQHSPLSRGPDGYTFTRSVCLHDFHRSSSTFATFSVAFCSRDSNASSSSHAARFVP